jgi:putative glutamine amidotransferase
MAWKRPRPLIGITGPDRGGGAAWFFTKLAVRRAGGRARRITPRKPLPPDLLDGLIIGGGADVDPELYGEERQEILSALREESKKQLPSRLKNLVTFPIVLVLRRLFSATTLLRKDEERDRLENDLIAGAIERQIPILGICRGAQLLNVYFGGTLHQDLVDFYTETPQIRTVMPRKKVLIERDSCLSRILGTQSCFVNAMHRQAVNRLGDEIVAVAREPNEVIQAIEHSSSPFILGLQWHPEYMPQEEIQRRIFRALIAEAQQVSERRE